MNYKSLSNSIKDVDTSQGIVTGYFSAFGNIDDGMDMVVKGAFSESIKSWGVKGSDRIKHLWQHDGNKPIGKITLLKEDDYGLYFESKLSKTQLGQDALIQYQEGILKEHSIGYSVIQEEKKLDGKGNLSHYELQKVKLWEGSTVTWGMNEMALVNEVKSIEQFNNYLDQLERKSKLGNLSDDELNQTEKMLKRLKELVKLKEELTKDDLTQKLKTIFKLL